MLRLECVKKKKRLEYVCVCVCVCIILLFYFAYHYNKYFPIVKNWKSSLRIHIALRRQAEKLICINLEVNGYFQFAVQHLKA